MLFFFVAATRIISAAWLPLVLNISHEWTGFQITSTAGAEKMTIFIKGRRTVVLLSMLGKGLVSYSWEYGFTLYERMKYELQTLWRNRPKAAEFVKYRKITAIKL